MIDYALNNLVDDVSLAGVLLALLPIFFFHWIKTGSRWLIMPGIGLLVLMSIPITGKLLLAPLEIGTLHGFDKEATAPDFDAIAVISNEEMFEVLKGAPIISRSAYIRIYAAESIAISHSVPLLLSDGNNKSIPLDNMLPKPMKVRLPEHDLFSRGGAHSTALHVDNIVQMAKDAKVSKIALVMVGHHAFRTRALLRAKGIEVPVVYVGARHSEMRAIDIVPSFESFYFWKLALKEYIGLAKYWVEGQIRFEHL